MVLERQGEKTSIKAANRLSLSDTRSRAVLVAFQSVVVTTLNDAAPERIAIKAKPENGRMRAGAAALKMEGIVLANAHCDVQFISGARVNRVETIENGLYAYLQDALKTALAAL